MLTGIGAGVSTACMYPFPMVESLRALGERGVKRVEVFVDTFSELSTETLREVKAILSHYDMRASALHPFTCAMETMLFYSVYPGRWEDGLEMYKKYFRFAAEIGAKIFVLHGPKMASEISLEATYERYFGLYRVGREFGVRVAQENVSRTLGGSLDYLMGMKKTLKDQCAFVVDVKQARRVGLEPLEVFRALGENAVHVHYSEESPHNDCVAFGEGHMDRAALRETLVSMGFKGDLILELYGTDGHGAEELAASYRGMENFFCKNPVNGL